jgi:hypothetical protein
LRTQAQVASLARMHFTLVDGSRLGEVFDEEIAALREVLGVVSFVLGGEESGVLGSEESGSIIRFGGVEPAKRRELYELVRNMVRGIEQRGDAVALAGTYVAGTDLPQLLPTAEIGLISFFPKVSHPGAIKRKMLLAPSQIVLKHLLKGFDEAVCRTTEVAGFVIS